MDSQKGFTKWIPRNVANNVGQFLAIILPNRTYRLPLQKYLDSFTTIHEIKPYRKTPRLLLIITL